MTADEIAWTQKLQSLDARRARAFWALDLKVLDGVYVPGSSPWQADRALLSSYRDQQLRVQGLRIQIDKAVITRRTPTSIALKTTDHLTGGQAVDRAGTITRLPPGAPTTRLITLTISRPGQPWRIAAITDA
ncbi:hypothetical protein GCM10009804_44160 [Kribbella hippodromi]|uniref:DUF4440 domain-containing protein n=1 Tax=Kribbella hippodromi TaxID=434347 RepID=A0ABP4PJC5_9ACTN